VNKKDEGQWWIKKRKNPQHIGRLTERHLKNQRDEGGRNS